MTPLSSTFQQIDEFGRFQRSVYAVLQVLTVLQCCQTFLLVFVADKPQWQCSQKEQSFVENDPPGFPCLKNGSMCRNITFDDEFTSIASEWKLICDQGYKTNLAQAIVMAGCLAGAVLFGGLADRYGRKWAIILMQSLASVCSLASGFAESIEQFLILRFVVSATLTNSGMTIFVLISEIFGPNRDFYLTAHQAFYSLGYVVLSIFAYYVRDWRNLTLVISLPSLACAMFFLKDICESPQWLLENGDTDTCKKLLKTMAKTNGSTLPEKCLQELTMSAPKDNLKPSQSLLSVFATEGYLKKVTVLSIVWICFAMMYYGLSFASGATNSNKYLSFSFSGLVEIPSLVVSMLLIKSGRRMPLLFLAMAGALSCFSCGWLLSGGGSASFFISFSAMLGKFGVTACYNILYIFSAEQFTASVRSFSMGICSTAASLGGILAPLVVSLDMYDKRLPMFAFGTGAISAAILVVTLPETLERHMETDDKED